MTPENFLVWAQFFPEPLFLLSSQGVVLAGNGAAGALLGVSAPTLAGKRFMDLVTTPTEQVAAYLRSCSRVRTMLFGNLTFRTQDGRLSACRTEGAVLRPRTAESSAILLLRCRPKPETVEPFLQLNERLEALRRAHQKLQHAYADVYEQREWFQQTLRSIGDAVIATDDRGCVTLLNGVAQTLTGWTEDEARGRNVEDIFRIINMGTRQVVENPIRRVLRQGMIVGLANHSVLIARDGTERPIDDSGAPIRNLHGQLIGVVLVFRDVTERLQSERLLQQSNAELEQRIAERTEALRQEMAERQRLERETQRTQHFALLGRLAAGVSHEIRNPLGVVFLQVDVLEEELHDLLPESPAPIVEALREIKTHLGRLDDLVQDYLSLVRVASLERTSQDLGRALQGWQQEWQRLATAKGILLRLQGLETLGSVTFHASTLQRVFLNLIQNALEAMDAGGTLNVIAERHPGVVCLTIEDTGEGIPPEKLSQIFEPLYTTKPGGTGLGLYLALEIVTAHGGKIDVTSQVGVGTTCAIVLPTESLEDSPVC